MKTLILTILLLLSVSANAEIDRIDDELKTEKVITFNQKSDLHVTVKMEVYAAEDADHKAIIEDPQGKNYLFTRRLDIKLEEATTIGQCEVPVSTLKFNLPGDQFLDDWGYSGELERDDGTVLNINFQEERKPKRGKSDLTKKIYGQIEILKYKGKSCNPSKPLKF